MKPHTISAGELNSGYLGCRIEVEGSVGILKVAVHGLSESHEVSRDRGAFGWVQVVSIVLMDKETSVQRTVGPLSSNATVIVHDRELSPVGLLHGMRKLPSWMHRSSIKRIHSI